MRLLVLLLFAGCGAGSVALEAPDSDGMRAMLVAIEDRGEIKVYARDLEAARPIELEISNGAVAIAALLYRDPLSAFGLQAGEVKQASPQDAYRPLPGADAIYQARLDPSFAGWEQVGALGAPFAAIHLPPLDPQYGCDTFVETTITLPTTSSISVLGAFEDGAAVAVTFSGEAYRVVREGTARLRVNLPFGISAGVVSENVVWMASQDGDVWRLDLLQESAELFAEDKFETPPVSMAISKPGAPYELFGLSERGKLMLFDGVFGRDMLDLAPLDAPHVERRLFWRQTNEVWIADDSPDLIVVRAANLERVSMGWTFAGPPARLSMLVEWGELGTILAGNDLASGAAVFRQIDGRWLAHAPPDHQILWMTRSAVVLGDDLIFAGEDGFVAEYRKYGGFCRPRTGGRRHWVHAARLTADDAVFAGPPVFGAETGTMISWLHRVR